MKLRVYEIDIYVSFMISSHTHSSRISFVSYHIFLNKPPFPCVTLKNDHAVTPERGRKIHSHFLQNSCSLTMKCNRSDRRNSRRSHTAHRQSGAVTGIEFKYELAAARGCTIRMQDWINKRADRWITKVNR